MFTLSSRFDADSTERAGPTTFRRVDCKTHKKKTRNCSALVSFVEFFILSLDIRSDTSGSRAMTEKILSEVCSMLETYTGRDKVNNFDDVEQLIL